jgi:hypothetical protein
MVLMTHANGKVAEFSWYHLATIPTGKSLIVAAVGRQFILGLSDSPVTSIKLWTAVFADGELRGVDPHAGAAGIASFQGEIERKFQIIVEAGKLAKSGDWLELNKRAAQERVPGDFWANYTHDQAKKLVDARNGSGGEPAAQAIADNFQKLPEHLWRAK